MTRAASIDDLVTDMDNIALRDRASDLRDPGQLLLKLTYVARDA